MCTMPFFFDKLVICDFNDVRFWTSSLILLAIVRNDAKKEKGMRKFEWILDRYAICCTRRYPVSRLVIWSILFAFLAPIVQFRSSCKSRPHVVGKSQIGRISIVRILFANDLTGGTNCCVNSCLEIFQRYLLNINTEMFRQDLGLDLW